MLRTASYEVRASGRHLRIAPRKVRKVANLSLIGESRDGVVVGDVKADEIIFASLADESITIVTGTVSGTSNDRTLDELQARLDPQAERVDPDDRAEQEEEDVEAKPI